MTFPTLLPTELPPTPVCSECSAPGTEAHLAPSVFGAARYVWVYCATCAPDWRTVALEVREIAAALADGWLPAHV